MMSFPSICRPMFSSPITTSSARAWVLQRNQVEWISWCLAARLHWHWGLLISRQHAPNSHLAFSLRNFNNLHNCVSLFVRSLRKNRLLLLVLSGRRGSGSATPFLAEGAPIVLI